jgi:hypothetical protein
MADFEWRRCEGLDSINAFRECWQSASEGYGQNRPFCGPNYVISALRAYHQDHQPSLIIVSSGGACRALLPFVSRPLNRMSYRVNEFGSPFNPNVTLTDPIITAGSTIDRQTVLANLIEGAFASAAATIIVDNVPVADGLPELFREVARILGLRSDPVRVGRSMYFAALDGDWERYLSTRSRNHRWQLKKVVRNAGSLSVERHSGRRAIREQLPVWFAVERRSWQGATPAAAMTDRDRHFHALLLDSLVEEEVGDLWIVRLSSEPIAALRMLAAPGRVSVHTMHFDVAHRELKPGLIAFRAMMRDACERGLAEVDMHGSTEFFARWATGQRAHASIRLYRRGLQSFFLQKGRWLVHSSWTHRTHLPR